MEKAMHIFRVLKRCYNSDNMVMLNRYSCSAGKNVDQMKPLHGITVLDMTRVLAGPYCTMILGDLGADVIKVERPIIGDDTRGWGPPFVGDQSCYFLSANRNKRSICIDMKAKEGQSLLRDLACKSDILVENFVPGNLDKFGLGYSQLAHLNPSLVYCSITGYGPDGPYRDKPGYDVIAASVGGLLSITGTEDGEPCRVGVAMTDLATGLYAHGSILAALFQRNSTGVGQKIDVDLLSTQLACLANVGSSSLNGNVEPKRWGTAHESIVPYQAFKTNDGYITVGAGNDGHFKSLCEKLEIPELSVDPKFSTNRQRVVHRKELIPKLADLFAKKSTKSWLKLLEGSNFPHGPLNTVSDAFSDEHVKDIGLVRELDHPAGRVKVVGPPVRYSSAANEIYLPPPTLGQHTDKILEEKLKLEPMQITRLRELRIVS